MIRRNTETAHQIADSLFSQLNITDLQGLLRENDQITCGVECYQLEQNEIFLLQPNQSDTDRYYFCKAFNVPYYIISSSPSKQEFQIFQFTEHLNLVLTATLSEQNFLNWWRSKQSFTQQKPMYEAGVRIEHSYIDQILFLNKLAWGVNIDGFKLNEEQFPEYIIEKRITSYDVKKYDPQRFFHGTPQKSGDYSSWNILKKLSEQLNIPLLLATFDKTQRLAGITRILDVSLTQGLYYSNPIQHHANSQLVRQDIARLLTIKKTLSAK